MVCTLFDYDDCFLNENDPYEGKYFSVLGDSISTLEGWNPAGYHVFYTGNHAAVSGVTKMEDTWWGQVIQHFGGQLLVNNSWSGSRVTRLPDSNIVFPSACSDERTCGLHTAGALPDVILVYMGTNDWASGASNESGNSGFDLSAMEIFENAYTVMLQKLKRNYPNAEIWCCTISPSRVAGNPLFHFPKVYRGNDVTVYNRQIKETADRFGCRLLDLWSEQDTYDSIDGTHPSKQGMAELSEYMIRGFEMSEERERIRSLVSYDPSWEWKQGLASVRGTTIDLSYGMFPIRNIICKNGDSVSYCNKLNPRDGGRRVPNGFLDEKTLRLNHVQREQLAEIAKGFELQSAPDERNEIPLCGGPIKDIYRFTNADGQIFDIANYKDIVSFFESLCEFPRYEVIPNEVLDSDDMVVIWEEEMKINDRYLLLKEKRRENGLPVFTAKDEETDQIVCIKILACPKRDRQQKAQQLKQEAAFLGQLHHPMIPRLLAWAEEEEGYLVREDIPGRTLREIMEREGPQPVDLVLKWTAQLCDVLGYLHGQNPPYIHRNVTPESIVLQPDGAVKLVNFSVMRTYKPNQTEDTLSLGTVGYAAPEQYGGHQTDPRTDIYILGKTMEALLIGEAPKIVPGKTLREVNPYLPEQVEKIIAKCTSLNPEDRFQSCDELLQALTDDMKKTIKGFFQRLFGR